MPNWVFKIKELSITVLKNLSQWGYSNGVKFRLEIICLATSPLTLPASVTAPSSLYPG